MDRRSFIGTTSAGAAAAALAPSLLSGCLAAGGRRDGRDAIARAAIETALDIGAAYADCRVTSLRFRSIGVRGPVPEGVQDAHSLGFGLRVLVDGCWGFAASPTLDVEDAAAVARTAVAVARANRALLGSEIRLAHRPVRRDASWTTPIRIDPWSVPLPEVLDLLVATNEAAAAVPRIRFARASLAFQREDTLFACSDGSRIEQTVFQARPLVVVGAASDDGDFQSRQSTELPPLSAGYEYVLDAGLPDLARGLADDAVQKLAAAPVEPGTYDLVIHPSNLFLNIHETIGHPTELDRALGYEANWGGTSFLAPPEAFLGRFRYGPEIMNVVGDRTSPGGLATAGFDHDGVETGSWHIVRDGIFVDYQTSRDQVHWIGELTGRTTSHGTCHASTWDGVQFQRMPNVNLLPGEDDVSVDDIIGETRRGIYIVGSGSWSIDQQRYNFQFTGQMFYEIRDGAIHRRLRDVGYHGRTPEFWNSLDRLGGESTYLLCGVTGDGKGQPEQLNAVSHGCPAARFRNVAVINTGAAR